MCHNSPSTQCYFNVRHGFGQAECPFSRLMHFVVCVYRGSGSSACCRKQPTVEAVDLCDLPTLVVTAQQRHLVRPPSLEAQQQRERLQAVVAAVYKVSLQNTSPKIVQVESLTLTECNMLQNVTHPA